MNQPRRGGWWHVPLRAIAALALGAWLGGLVMAAFQLSAWSAERVRTLLQIRADAVFRMRMEESREPVPREWFRSKTLALLAASEKLHDEALWVLFIPGAQQPFDDLRQRVAARIERAFSDIAVETIRRELYFRASRLTGVDQDGRTGELLIGGDCAPPMPMPDQAIAGPQGLPELVAVRNQLAAIEELDQAMRAMLALHSGASADAEDLRLLVRYTLGVELPGRLSRSAAFFRSGLKPEDVTYAATGLPRLQWAARCSIAKAMRALDTRLFERNDLLAAESRVGQRAAWLFAPGARPAKFNDAVTGYREVIAALDEQEALLAQADDSWLHDANARLSPAHDRLLARIARVGLLGPDAAEQIRRQSGAAVQRFRHHFAAVFGGRGEAPLMWQPELGRWALSPQRLALRDGLRALLQEQFMQSPGGRALPLTAPAPLAWDTRRLEQALSLKETRRRFAAESLPNFPAAVRPRIAQFVDARLAQLVEDATVQAMRPASAADALNDMSAYRAQREQLAKVETLLGQLGAHARAENLRALLSRDVLERLALMEQAMWSASIHSGRNQDFWPGQAEGSPAPQAFETRDRLDEFGRTAGDYLAYVDPSIASSPTVLRWQGIVAELKRYRAGIDGPARTR